MINCRCVATEGRRTEDSWLLMDDGWRGWITEDDWRLMDDGGFRRCRWRRRRRRLRRRSVRGCLKRRTATDGPTANGTTDRWTAEPPPVWIRLVLKIMSWEGKETRNSAGSTCLMFHVSCMMYDDWWLIIDVCYDQNRCLLLNSLFILHSFNHSYLQIWRGIFLPLTRIPVGKASLFTFTLMLILRFSMRRMA